MAETPEGKPETVVSRARRETNDAKRWWKSAPLQFAVVIVVLILGTLIYLKFTKAESQLTPSASGSANTSLGAQSPIVTADNASHVNQSIDNSQTINQYFGGTNS